LGRKLVYELEVFQGYQRILDQKMSKHFMEGGIKRNKGFYESGKWRYAL
jgi:hypothetical protein